MQVLIFDTEVTGAQRNKGNPYDPRNKLCIIGSKFISSIGKAFDVEYSDNPYGHILSEFQRSLYLCNLVVGFNLKFDLAWGRRYGIKFNGKRLWDCQLYHFIQTNQTIRMPSLQSVAEFWGVPGKLDIVKTEYWDKGLDTDQVPWNILSEYALADLDVTEAVFQKQWAEFQTLPENRRKLIFLQMRDLMTLHEMEYNGFLYDRDLSLKMGIELEDKIIAIDKTLATYCDIAINFNSDEQLSLFLYGGKLIQKEREEYVFQYKDPKKPPITKERWVEKEYILPRIFTPLERTEKEKDGIFSTDKTTLTKLKKGASRFQLFIIDTLLERSKLEQRKSTYCFGTVKLMDAMCWEHNILHGQLHQTVVVTGRLSSSKPNLQNQDEKMQICFKSRFKWNNLI